MWHQDIINRGKHQDGGRVWFGGYVFEDGTLEEFDEDCRFPIVDLSGSSPRSPEDSLFPFNFADIDESSEELGIPWEFSKDTHFAYANPYIGLVWDLARLVVYLDEPKKRKYLLAIEIWQGRKTHVLNDVQQLYGKLLHTTLVIPCGRAYLTSLETMLHLGSIHPFLPRHPVKTLAVDLVWWISVLKASFLGRSIPIPLTTLHDPAAFSDASSAVGVAIVIGPYWRAWRLRPGWRTLDGEKDIGWAEAVGFELLVQYLVQLGGPERNFRVFGDDQGIIEGWRNGRSRNPAVNTIFRRIFSFLNDCTPSYSFHLSYVASEDNPADDPSRGIYSSTDLLLPEFPIPDELNRFIDDPFSSSLAS